MHKEDVDEIKKASEKLRELLHNGASIELINGAVSALEDVAGTHLKPTSTMRDIFEMALVVITLALGARTFLIQPMKIPTGSMQPTLWGVTYENLKDTPDFQIPSDFKRYVDKWVYGISYHQLIAQCDGELRAIEPIKRICPFISKQRFLIGNMWHTLWFPPTTLSTPGTASEQALIASGVHMGQRFKKGEDVIKLKVKTGDYLFVNRLIYNFKKPERGEIVIFETRGIPGLQQDTFYIKRLIGLGGDTVSIGDDRHVVVNKTRIDAATPNFEIVYGFDPNSKYIPNTFFGHVNSKISRENGGFMTMLDGFQDASKSYTLPEEHALVMGDNTMNSYDSRAWGAFPESKIIGRAGFVYWPISERWSWGYR